MAKIIFMLLTKLKNGLKMVNVITEININKAIDIVANYASQPDNAPLWYKNIKSAEWKSPAPLVLGSKVAFVAHFLGQKLTYTYEFIEIIPNQKLVMRTFEGPFPMETTYTWTAIDAHVTKMTLQNKGDPKGFSKIFSPFMSMMMRKANTNDLKN